jgi:hypothetical protein
MTSRTMRYLLVALIAAGSLAWSACGASDTFSSNASAAEIVRLAGERSANAESFAFDVTIEMNMSGLGRTKMTMGGVADLVSGRARAEASFAGMDMTVITEGNTSYTKMDLLGDKWLKMSVDLPALNQDAGSTYNDPSQQLAWLQYVSDDVREAGTQNIRGRSTTKYVARVSPSRVAELFDEDSQEYLELLNSFFTEDDFQMEVWVDADGLPAKVFYAMDLNIEGMKMSAKYTMEYFDWGKPVHIELPPADEVVDGPDISALFGGS